MRDLESNIEEALQREKEAELISELSIYRNVVENVIEMEGSMDDKISILLTAVPDLGIIMSQLSLCKHRGLLNNDLYTKIMESCLLEVQRRKVPISFNPSRIETNGG